MNTIRMLAVVLVVTGALELLHGSFSYADEAREAGSLTDQHTVNIPVWIGTGNIILGGVLMLFVGLRHMRRDAWLRYY